MSYLSTTDAERSDMLKAIGVASVGELFLDIPESVRKTAAVDLPQPLSEIEAEADLAKLAALNTMAGCFAGAGSYRHYIPAAVDQLTLRSEFYTAYTPYQPEVSQGTLTAIFEYQTMICRLSGMDIANASLYDGATACAEAMLMSSRETGRTKILVSKLLHPHYRETLATYAWANGITIEELSFENGLTDLEAAKKHIGDDVSAVFIQNPNFFGGIENLQQWAECVHAKGAHLVAVVNEAISMGLLAKPGDMGADILCGEGQAFGNYVSFGGPGLGLCAAKKQFMRKMPGRMIGRTVDADGKEAYALTLQTREQHIRREKATSNICSNEGLCALRATIYLSLIGERLGELAAVNHRLASLLRHGLIQKGWTAPNSAPYFNEFVLIKKGAADIVRSLKEKGILAGVELAPYYNGFDDAVLFCVTELNSPDEIQKLIELL